MVEPRNPFMGPRRRRPSDQVTNDSTPELGDKLDSVIPSGRQGYGGRPRKQIPNRQPRPRTIEIPKVEHEAPPVRPQSKPVRSDSLLEALIKLMNSVLRFKGK
jgi:hypothetical protein